MDLGQRPIKILMIEDDLELAELIGENLNRVGFLVKNYPLPKDGIQKLKEEQFDLVILDLSLPQMDGLEVIREIRNFSDIPILISSARGELEDKREAFQREADDYLPKPYDLEELLWRIKALIRRYRNRKPPTPQQEGTQFQVEEGEILYNGKPLKLTFGEYQILAKLIKNRGRIVPKEELLLGWESDLKSVEVLISRIRRKLPKNCIETVRRIGYRFVCK
ncbi:MAG: response regulator transcription factor [Campylobacterales bacterium]